MNVQNLMCIGIFIACGTNENVYFYVNSKTLKLAVKGQSKIRVHIRVKNGLRFFWERLSGGQD